MAARAGEHRKTPRGDVLEAVWPHTYWYHEFPEVKGMWLSDFLRVVLRKLAAHQEFFGRIRSTGGETSLRIGWFSGFMSGDTLDWELLRGMARLQLDLELHVYAQDDRDDETSGQ